MNAEPRSRGLTLVETLLAIALLALVTTAGAGLLAELRGATGEVDARASERALRDLDAFVDRIVFEPKRFALETAWHELPRAGVEVEVDGRLVRIAPAECGGSTGHTLVRFECEGSSVVRWFVVPNTGGVP